MQLLQPVMELRVVVIMLQEARIFLLKYSLASTELHRPLNLIHLHFSVGGCRLKAERTANERAEKEKTQDKSDRQADKTEPVLTVQAVYRLLKLLIAVVDGMKAFLCVLLDHEDTIVLL